MSITMIIKFVDTRSLFKCIILPQGQTDMTKKDKDNAIKNLKISMAEATEKVHLLSKERKEVAAMIRDKNNNVDYCFSKDVNRLREQERTKRLQIYGEVEDQRQRVTSALVMELLQFCQQADAPPYIIGIAKVLDNFQGICFNMHLIEKLQQLLKQP